MDYTVKNLGYKFYGLYCASKLGLFPKKFVLLDDVKTKDEIINKLKREGFKDYMAVAVRFSKENVMNLPSHLGKYTLDEIAEIIIKVGKDYVPGVNELIVPETEGFVFYDKDKFFVELLPGSEFSKTCYEPCDIIIFNDNKATIYRYKLQRDAQDVTQKIYVAKPYSMNYLESVAKRFYEIKNKIVELNKIFDPLLYDFLFDANLNLYFMGLQKTKSFDLDNELMQAEGYYVADTIEKLRTYFEKNENKSRKLFFDIPMERNDSNFGEIVDLAKKCKEVYVKSIIMHFAVILREFGVDVKRATKDLNNYEKKEIMF